MEKITRNYNDSRLQPIIDNWLDWGNQWRNCRHKFTWRKTLSNGSSIDLKKDILNELLIELTENRCSFCDYFPLVNMAHFKEGLSVEHFFPKKKEDKYAVYAYCWANLFPICQKCNNIKDDRFSSLLLKPDRDSYDFDKYFIIRADGKIEPNPAKHTVKQKRAEKTIELYDLNRGELVENRRKRVEEFETLVSLYDNSTVFGIRPLDKEPYRFFINRFVNVNDTEKDFDVIFNDLIQDSIKQPQTTPNPNE